MLNKDVHFITKVPQPCFGEKGGGGGVEGGGILYNLIQLLHYKHHDHLCRHTEKTNHTFLIEQKEVLFLHVSYPH